MNQQKKFNPFLNGNGTLYNPEGVPMKSLEVLIAERRAQAGIQKEQKAINTAKAKALRAEQKRIREELQKEIEDSNFRLEVNELLREIDEDFEKNYQEYLQENAEMYHIKLNAISN